MKSRTIWLIAAVALVCGLGLGSRAQTKTQEHKGWEYQTYYAAPTQISSYNNLGAEGWELAAVSCPESLNQCAFFFKRQK